jgi:hypothetical protein
MPKCSLLLCLCRCGSVLPKSIEPIRCQLRVANRVLDVSVPQVMLDGPGVVAVIGQLEAAAVA